MAYEIVKTKSIKATAAITTPFVFVKLDSNGQAVLGTAGSYCIGVNQDKPSAGDPTAVCFPGDITKVLCGAAFAAGADVMCGTNGKCVAATSGSFILGQALAASGADGAVVPIIYQPKASKL